MFDSLAMVNLNRQGRIFENIDDKEIENKILQQIQLHHNNPKVKKRWENTKAFIEMDLMYQMKIFFVNLSSPNILKVIFVFVLTQ
jgi:hypothetical protein